MARERKRRRTIMRKKNPKNGRISRSLCSQIFQCTAARASSRKSNPTSQKLYGGNFAESDGKCGEADRKRGTARCHEGQRSGHASNTSCNHREAQNVGYITMQGKMQLTLKGRTAIELIRRAGVDLLTSPEMTGQWERRLYQISKGKPVRTSLWRT